MGFQLCMAVGVCMAYMLMLMLMTLTLMQGHSGWQMRKKSALTYLGNQAV